MRRTTALLATTTLALLAACGGGDDTADTTIPPAAEEPAAEEPAAEEPAADEEQVAGDDSADEPSGPVIDSIDDIPPECRELMGGFLRDLEPMVTDIDWQNATLNDFEAISGDFEARADEFDAESEAAGCDDLDFGEDEGFGLVIEFAEDEAPGTVPFFEFLDNLISATGVAGDTGGSDGGTDGFANCDEAIAAIEGLMGEYDGFSDVPMSDVMNLAGLGSVMMSCTPEQLDFFDSDEVTDFMGR